MKKVKASIKEDFFICGNCGCLVYKESEEQHDRFETMMVVRSQLQ